MVTDTMAGSIEVEQEITYGYRLAPRPLTLDDVEPRSRSQNFHVKYIECLRDTMFDTMEVI